MTQSDEVAKLAEQLTKAVDKSLYRSKNGHGIFFHEEDTIKAMIPILRTAIAAGWLPQTTGEG